MVLPRFFIVGERPLKLEATPVGGMAVLAWDWNARTFVQAPSYLARCVLGDPEVDEVDERTFRSHLERLDARGQ